MDTTSTVASATETTTADNSNDSAQPSTSAAAALATINQIITQQLSPELSQQQPVSVSLPSLPISVPVVTLVDDDDTDNNCSGDRNGEDFILASLTDSVAKLLETMTAFMDDESVVKPDDAPTFNAAKAKCISSVFGWTCDLTSIQKRMRHVLLLQNATKARNKSMLMEATKKQLQNKHQVKINVEVLTTSSSDGSSGEEASSNSAQVAAVAQKEFDIKQELVEVLENEATCSICEEIFLNTTMTKCGHVYCSYCISTWAKDRRNCPQCRSFISYPNDLIKHSSMDSLISKLSDRLTEEFKEKRNVAVEDRKKAVTAAAATAATLTSQSSAYNFHLQEFLQTLQANLSDTNSEQRGSLLDSLRQARAQTETLTDAAARRQAYMSRVNAIIQRNNNNNANASSTTSVPSVFPSSGSSVRIRIPLSVPHGDSIESTRERILEQIAAATRASTSSTSSTSAPTSTPPSVPNSTNTFFQVPRIRLNRDNPIRFNLPPGAFTLPTRPEPVITAPPPTSSTRRSASPTAMYDEFLASIQPRSNPQPVLPEPSPVPVRATRRGRPRGSTNTNTARVPPATRSSRQRRPHSPDPEDIISSRTRGDGLRLTIRRSTPQGGLSCVLENGSASGGSSVITHTSTASTSSTAVAINSSSSLPIAPPGPQISGSQEEREAQAILRIRRWLQE